MTEATETRQSLAEYAGQSLFSYILGLGDCIEEMDHISPASVDLVLCDLPYGTTACAWDSIIPFDALWDHYKRVLKPDGTVILFGSQPFTSALGSSNLPWLKYAWAWRKSRATGHLNAKKMPMKDLEDVLVFKPPGGSRYFPQGLTVLNKKQKNSTSHRSVGSTRKAIAVVSGGITKDEYIQEFTGYPRQVLDFPSEGATLHPTQKPVALCEYLIRTYTSAGDVVLDNTMGSGTTGVACVNTERRFIGIEKDPRHFDIASNRIRDAVSERYRK